MKYCVVMDWWDGSGQPEVLAVFDTKERAQVLLDIIQRTCPTNRVIISESAVDVIRPEEARSGV